jgi:hypothetical protein
VALDRAVSRQDHDSAARTCGYVGSSLRPRPKRQRVAAYGSAEATATAESNCESIHLPGRRAGARRAVRCGERLCASVDLGGPTDPGESESDASEPGHEAFHQASQPCGPAVPSPLCVAYQSAPAAGSGPHIIGIIMMPTTSAMTFYTSRRLVCWAWPSELRFMTRLASRIAGTFRHARNAVEPEVGHPAGRERRGTRPE